MPHKFSPQSIERLLRPDRLGGTTPEKFLQEAGLASGMTFADVGCGPGFFTLPAALVVGDAGIVYAIDTQAEMLYELEKRKRAGLAGGAGRVIAIRCGEHTMPLRAGCVDFALIGYTLHEAASKRLFLNEIGRILKPGGRLLVLDWEKIKEDHGPPFPDRVERAEAETLAKGAGFRDVRASGFTGSHYRIDAEK